MGAIINLLIGWLAVLISAYLVPGIKVADYFTALVVVVVLGLLNIFIKPMLIIFTLPINILSLGLFTLVINTLIIILASKIVDGFSVASFWSAFTFSLILALVNYFLHSFSR